MYSKYFWKGFWTAMGVISACMCFYGAGKLVNSFADLLVGWVI